MEKTTNSKIGTKKTFYVIGLSYKKADAKMRGLFSIQDSMRMAMLIEAKEEGIDALSVLSTCNRTELYGVSENPFQLIRILCKYTQGSIEEFDRLGYVYKEKEAVLHTFLVGTGLDSQILGDFEIISQLRTSFRISKEEGMLNTYMERLINSVIQASKRIKNETTLSSGATSVSFAAVQYMMQQVPDISQKNILLFGTGKIGRNTVENLVKHTKNQEVTLINRTRERAEAVAGKFNLIVKDSRDLAAEACRADVLIVATGALQPTVTAETLKNIQKPLLILDLSVPQNVSDEVLQIPYVQYVHMDELSKITKETLNYREAQIPRAHRIIDEIKEEFLEWVHVRRFAPIIRALKERFNEIKTEEIDYQSKKTEDFNSVQAELLGDRIVQKIITQFASYLRTNDAGLEENLELLTQVFQLNLKE